MADLLGANADEWIALAGRVPQGFAKDHSGATYSRALGLLRCRRGIQLGAQAVPGHVAGVHHRRAAVGGGKVVRHERTSAENVL
jgi:hypothetical protein